MLVRDHVDREPNSEDIFKKENLFFCATLRSFRTSFSVFHVLSSPVVERMLYPWCRPS